jgi:anti-sigma B factor antagonist
MNVRIRKIPRPEDLRKFSGAKGSGRAFGRALKADGDVFGGVILVAMVDGVDRDFAHRAARKTFGYNPMKIYRCKPIKALFTVTGISGLQYTPPMSTENLTFELLEGASPSEHIYQLKGPMVLGNMFAFQEVLRSEPATTILDLTGVPYMDSAGLGILTNSYVSHQKNGRRLLLVGVNERVQTLFQVTRLDKLFQIFPTLDGARQALSGKA